MKKAFFLPLFVLCGCSTLQINRSISIYSDASIGISLGDSKSNVLATLNPTQECLSQRARKRTESFVAPDGKIVEIHFFRSARIPDNLTTDDEFTPYVFKDGKLIAIGWAYLGGPKTQGKADRRTTVIVEHEKGY